MLKQKTFKDNKLFDFLDYIFKKKNNQVKDYNPPSFLINRWISMASPLYAKIVNSTTNKWLLSNHNFDITSFYRTILPKDTTRISYVKKTEIIKDQVEDLNLSSSMECSQREIIFFNQTLEELNLINK
jgi:hypothetical protein